MGCRTGTAELEAKLLQDLMAIRVTVLFKVFLDIQKSYETLDQDRCLGILVTYGEKPRMI